MKNFIWLFFIILSLSACKNEQDAGSLDYQCFQYLYGADNVPKDIEKAIPLCKKAAEAGAAGSQNVMGMIYLDTDREQAIYWLKKAAVQGHTGAIEQLRLMDGR